MEPIENNEPNVVEGGQPAAVMNHQNQIPDLPEATLADLPEKLRAGAARAGWTELLPVQRKAIPYLFSQHDMMIQSRTGSGKTGAYLLPILELVNPYQRGVQALSLIHISEPTRLGMISY